MKILVHAPSPSDGTSFYRAFGPLNALSKLHPEIEITKLDTGIAWDVLTRYDIVFIQRPASPWEVTLVEMCNRYRIPVWCDWDDAYFDIPESSPRKKYYSNYNLDCIRICARKADLITVTTKFLYDKFKELNEKIHIVPNAMDQRLFDPMDSVDYPRDNVILWRGSDTHAENLEFFKEQLIELMDKTEEYVWAFFGFCPDWAIDHLPSNRIRVYQNDGCIEYIQRLFSIRPKLIYVCHTNNDFNKSRSNIAWQEATYAGAICVVPDSEEWMDLPAYHYDTRTTTGFVDNFLRALNAPMGTITSAKFFLDENFNLEKINAKRRELLQSIINSRFQKPKTSPVEIPKQFSNEEFFNYNKEHGWTVENEEWVKGQDKTADMLKDDFNVTSLVDIGCGPGGLLESCIKKGIHCIGVDSNPFNQEFFVKRNPDYAHRFILSEAQDIRLEEKYDMIVSIEVFEHIPDEVNADILNNLRDHCKFFLFTSTPYHSTPEFDRQWGHINVKPKSHWVKFFEQNGFQFVQFLDWPTADAILFMSYPRQ